MRQRSNLGKHRYVWQYGVSSGSSRYTRHRIYRLALSPGWARRSNMVLRSAGAMAERDGGKYQPPCSQMASVGHRSVVNRASGPSSGLRPSQLNAPQMPRLQDVGRGVPAKAAGRQSVKQLPCPRCKVALRRELTLTHSNLCLDISCSHKKAGWVTAGFR